MDKKLEEIIEEHQEIVAMLARVEKITDQPTCGDLLIELGELIGTLDTTLRAHFAREEASELFTTFADEFPRFQRALDKLKAEHIAIQEKLAGLCTAFEQDPASQAGGICGDARELVENVRDHEQAERDIVQQAYGDDLGALD